MTDRPEAIQRYPLQWPVGWVRTLPHRREQAKFRKVETSYRPNGQGGTYAVKNDKPLTVFTAIARLEAELDRLGGQYTTLSTNVELRLDGRPRSDNEPKDPGVAIYFTFKGRATVFACDKWNRVADNIAAIAAHIDAVRRIERYGVGTLEQALAGYKALPADSAADWRQVFGFQKGSVPSLADVKAKHRERAKVSHPDVGGSDEQMFHINRALDYATTELTR